MIIPSYCSPQYLLAFLPIVLLLISITPTKVRRCVLLGANAVIFWCFSGKLILYPILSILSVHHIGIWLQSIQDDCDRALKDVPREEKKGIKAAYQKKQRMVLVFAVLLHIGVLAAVKYLPFFSRNINLIFDLFKSPIEILPPRIAAPMGISFYTMQALSYIYDVYRKKIPADKNLLRVALYMSFFPQTMEGPICRYSETADKLWNIGRVKYDNFMSGLLRIGYGLLKKMVVADRLNLFIKNIYEGYGEMDGSLIVLAGIAYTIQLYMEFSGTMDFILGSAQMLGVQLTENFQRPFFSSTISEFWKRWHITLGTWFRDYVFYPVSMSKPLKKLTMKARKKLGNHFGPLLAGAVALFCVWLGNGIWHGAGWIFIFFGMYHFFLILCGNIVDPLFEKTAAKLKINRNALPYKAVRIVRTTILVTIGEFFFRAPSLRVGLKMFKRIFTDFSLAPVKDGSVFTLGMDEKDFIIVGITVVIVFIISLLQENGVNITESIKKRNIVVRFLIYYALILFIVIFGAYGVNYIPVDPIYAEF